MTLPPWVDKVLAQHGSLALDDARDRDVRRVNPLPLDPDGERRAQLEQLVLVERARMLADEAYDADVAEAREREDARANEPAEVELGLRSIWSVPR